MKHLIISASLLLAATSASAESVSNFTKVDSCEYFSGLAGASKCSREIHLVADTYTREVFINIQLEGTPVQIQFALDAQAHPPKTVYNVVAFFKNLRGKLETVKHAEKDANGYRWSVARGSCISNGAGTVECSATVRDDIVTLKLKSLDSK